MFKLHPRQAAQPFGTLDLPGDEAWRFAAALHDVLSDAGRSPNLEALDAAARQALRQGILLTAPTLNAALAEIHCPGRDALYVRGLPHDEQLAELQALVLGRSMGELFNYTSQNGGRLLMRLEPQPGSPANTQTSADEFTWHTDDAWVPRDCRVEWLSLLGVHNPPATFTSYAPISCAVDELESGDHELLLDARYSVRAPISFGWGEDVWSDPRAILTRGPSGELEVAWPSYATRTLDPEDTAAQAALDRLFAASSACARHVALDPGCWLTFSNLRGVHARGQILNGRRLVLRTYSRSDLTSLRKATLSLGPAFDARLTVPSNT